MSEIGSRSEAATAETCEAEECGGNYHGGGLGNCLDREAVIGGAKRSDIGCSSIVAVTVAEPISCWNVGTGISRRMGGRGTALARGQSEGK